MPGNPVSADGRPPPRVAGEITGRLEQALALNRHGQVEQAEALLRRLVAQMPTEVDAWYWLGVVQAQQGRNEEAVASYDRALALQPTHVEALNKRGNALRGLQVPEEALASYDRALALDPDHESALYNRGNALLELKQPVAALTSFDRVLALRPDDAGALSDRGNALLVLDRPQEALASYDRALALQPDYAVALYNRGNVLLALERPADALENYDRALGLAPDLIEGHSNRGDALLQLKRPEDALASYDGALALRPDFAPAVFNRGNALLTLGRTEEALVSYDRALELRPDHAEALCNRGNVLQALKRHLDALASYGRAIAQRPDFADALAQRGAALIYLGRFEEAKKDLERAVALDPGLRFGKGMLLHVRMLCCDWTAFDDRSTEVVSAVRRGEPSAEPWFFLGISDSAEDQEVCARAYVAEQFPVPPTPLWHGERYAHDRIRVAYLSTDFREHALAYLTAGLFERHDRKRFETIAISSGSCAPSAMRSRLQAAFEHFIDVRQLGDRGLARLLRELEIDIAVDLNGFTTDARTGVLALRFAPIQVNYLGFPGTMGADYIDYIIGDRFVVPPGDDALYAEKVVRMPDTYQVNDRDRQIAGRTPTRKEAGLPQAGFVFCCFNNSFKITPVVFDAWMRLLHRVEGGVLWLVGGTASVEANLRREAAVHGVDPARLVFAARVRYAEYLARYRLADLFLDTLPYNAHTTASDALWAGLPVLTCTGTTFAGRVAGSLLNAAGLPELVTRSREDYEALALKLATTPAMLSAIRARLADNRLTCPLFDTNRFRRHIESAYTTMWERQQRGEPPASFAVAPIA